MLFFPSLKPEGQRAMAKWQNLSPQSVPDQMRPVQISVDGDTLDSSTRTLQRYVAMYGAANHIRWRYSASDGEVKP